ncbi:hypothetical protein ACFZBM_31830 [Streptomyces lavendulae]|uniref:Uncharacterized protein n=1 Tax=Streptomyces lavendulae subsp. lavendulae TaxID=58340 RepID=A0A2K8PR95_STRLA|nr:hypothetical protein [Streptomyces lavendulae]ATZ28968.1 hypothetical protein SLAV_36000 [Streptomyces lavendulae subsp. lavendulae]QUQ58793.1 hypothetical protein SLLC_34175 [Streptomyces lavendulae subsp. lavendulae]
MTHTNLREPATGNAAAGGNGKAASDKAIAPSGGGSRGEARADWQPIGYYYNLRGHGVFEQLLQAPGVTAYTGVFATVAEVYPPSDKPFMGGAVMTVHNVVPLDGERVEIRVDTGWPDDLPVRVQLLYWA